jgi:hypothetical protein
MRTQQDASTRVVALANLEAMCKHFYSPVINGRYYGVESGPGVGDYWIERVTRSRVWVGTVESCGSGEWADEPTSRVVYAVFPCYPSGWNGDTDNPRVVLDALRYVGGDDNTYAAFDALLDVTASRAGLDGSRWEVFPFERGKGTLEHMRAIQDAYRAREGASNE